MPSINRHVHAAAAAYYCIDGATLWGNFKARRSRRSTREAECFEPEKIMTWTIMFSINQSSILFINVATNSYLNDHRGENSFLSTWSAKETRIVYVGTNSLTACSGRNDVPFVCCCKGPAFIWDPAFIKSCKVCNVFMCSVCSQDPAHQRQSPKTAHHRTDDRPACAYNKLP